MYSCYPGLEAAESTEHKALLPVVLGYHKWTTNLCQISRQKLVKIIRYPLNTMREIKG